MSLRTYQIHLCWVWRYGWDEIGLDRIGLDSLDRIGGQNQHEKSHSLDLAHTRVHNTQFLCNRGEETWHTGWLYSPETHFPRVVQRLKRLGGEDRGGREARRRGGRRRRGSKWVGFACCWWRRLSFGAFGVRGACTVCRSTCAFLHPCSFVATVLALVEDAAAERSFFNFSK